ncbi:MAG: DUF116 domain-containing protein [Candidatus Heimdallarchaeota archaeon]|nr:MAG: DUF116 domain-containing protein [Candidatus Heimdallarchaeota archaeon]
MTFPYEITDEKHLTHIREYLKTVHQAQLAFTQSVTPILEKFLTSFDSYQQALSSGKFEIDYQNPLVYTRKEEYMLYMLLIEYSNHAMRAAFNTSPIKVVVLPRCLTGPNFDLLKVKRTRIGWHRIIGCNTRENPSCDGWKLTEIGTEQGFEVFITMGRRFKEPNFLKVFHNLRKKFGPNFGLLTVACLPELALGKTYIMEMGIPTQAVPLLFSGCAKWLGETQAVQTEFPMDYVLHLLKG